MSFAATWMNLEITVSGASQRKEKKSYDITYMQNLKKKSDLNELIFITETDLENKLMVTRREQIQEGIDWEFETDMFTLIYLKYITNKGLL